MINALNLNVEEKWLNFGGELKGFFFLFCEFGEVRRDLEESSKFLYSGQC